MTYTFTGFPMLALVAVLGFSAPAHAQLLGSDGLLGVDLGSVTEAAAVQAPDLSGGGGAPVDLPALVGDVLTGIGVIAPAEANAPDQRQPYPVDLSGSLLGDLNIDLGRLVALGGNGAVVGDVSAGAGNGTFSLDDNNNVGFGNATAPGGRRSAASGNCAAPETMSLDEMLDASDDVSLESLLRADEPVRAKPCPQATASESGNVLQDMLADDSGGFDAMDFYSSDMTDSVAFDIN